MAERKRKNKNPNINVPVLLLILAVCVVIIVVIVTLSGRDGGTDETTDPVSDVKTDETNGDTVTDRTDETADKPDESTDTDEVTTEETTEPDSGTSTDIGYVVETEVETSKSGDGDVTIVYPTIKPSTDGVDAELLNRLIKEYMDEKFENDGVSSIGGEYKYEITETETVLATDEFASIIIKGNYYVDGAPSPTIFTYTINCDIKASAIIPPSDLVYDFDIVKNRFLNGKFKLKEGMKDLLDETNYEDMIMEYKTEYGIYPNVYFTDTGFGMVIDLVYTLGGYALFEIPYADVEGAVLVPVK